VKLSTTFKIVAGDTFESIARKKYGTEQDAQKVSQANPGVSEPLTPGTVLTTPPSPDAPQNAPQQTESADPDEVALLIAGKRFRFWSNIIINRSIDNMDTISFGAPFEADSEDFRETFRPFTYKPLIVTLGGSPLFSGTMIQITPSLENKQKIVAVSGYSLPGVLNDCTPPASAYPLEFNGQGLQEIATTLAAPFGVGVEFQAEQGAIFERVAADPGKKVLAFLAELAKQRNLIISSTTTGKLLFLQSIETGTPVAQLRQGASPLESVTPLFNSQKYYSHITGIEPVIVGLPGSQYTVKNSRLEGVLRPFTFTTPDTLDADVKTAVQAKSSRMFGNMASYSLKVSTWRAPNGELWTPNTIIQLTAPGAMIYNAYDFVIKSVSFERNRVSRTAILNLVIPGAFSGKNPEVLPWEG
jgi:prophage tail gpP-like protein